MSLLASLPPSKAAVPQFTQDAPASMELAPVGVQQAPPYLRRKNFVPRKAVDFSDGGAFPEIHVAQYPLEMGRADQSRGQRTLAVSVDGDGGASYDAIVANRGRIVHSGHTALVPKVERMSKEVSDSRGATLSIAMHSNRSALIVNVHSQALARPDEEAIEEATRKTASALQLMVTNKMAITNPSTLPTQPGGPTYIKYTPAQQGAQYASGAGQRVIKMQDLPVDPLEPPKFRHTKVPRGPGSPPVPVLHSPPRKVTVQDQQNWKIPPCISNWKNPKVGFPPCEWGRCMRHAHAWGSRLHHACHQCLQYPPCKMPRGSANDLMSSSLPPSFPRRVTPSPWISAWLRTAAGCRPPSSTTSLRR